MVVGPEASSISRDQNYLEVTAGMFDRPFSDRDQVTQPHGKSDALMDIEHAAGTLITQTTWRTITFEQCKAYLNQLYTDIRTWGGNVGLRYLGQIVSDRIRILDTQQKVESVRWLNKWYSINEWPT